MKRSLAQVRVGVAGAALAVTVLFAGAAPMPGGFGPPGMGGGQGMPGMGGPGMPGGPGGFDMTGFGFGGMGIDVRSAIGATGEEWKVIGPLLQRYETARQNLEASRTGANVGVDVFAMLGGNSFSGPSDNASGMANGGWEALGFRPGTTPPSGTQNATAPATEPSTQPAEAEKDTLALAMADLRKAAENLQTSDRELGEKLRIVRLARQRAERQVAQVREDLLAVLTDREQAVLVAMGYLE